MTNRITVTILTFFCLTLFQASQVMSATPLNDQRALEGVESTRSLFDINVSSAEKLLLYLTVIKRSHQDLIRQNHKPDFVIAFRGPSVRLISTETWSLSEEDATVLTKAAALVTELRKMGVVLEACSIATELFKIDNKTILPEITVVGNTFVSLIGYQSKGYALIPIQ